MTSPITGKGLSRGLLAAIVVSEALYLLILRTEAISSFQSVAIFLGQLAALFVIYGFLARRVIQGRLDGTQNIKVVLIAAVLFRVTLIPAGLPAADSWTVKAGKSLTDLQAESVTFERYLLYDDDIWRYLWDGHVLSKGINPWLHAPESSALDHLEEGVWSEIRWNVNHPHLTSIYPPAAQGLFLVSNLAAPGSVVAMKIVLIAVDLAAILFLILALRALGRPSGLVLLYALNPLPVLVFAGSGHVDVLVVASLSAMVWLLAARRHVPAALALSIAILTKLSPLVLVPFVMGRLSPTGRITLIAALPLVCLPMLGSISGEGSGLVRFANHWEFNGGLYALTALLLEPVTSNPETASRAILALILGLSLLYMTRKDDGSLDHLVKWSMWGLGALLLCSPAVFPWYVTWLLPFAAILASGAWLAFSALVFVSMHVLIDGRQQGILLLAEYGVLFALLLAEFIRKNHPVVVPFTKQPARI